MTKYTLGQFLVLSAIIISSTVSLFAQEQLGLRLSNYAGINSTILNPAYHSTTPFSWDVNLVEGAVHFSNNYAFLRQINISHLIKNRDQLEFALASDFTEGLTPGPNTVVVDFFSFNRSRNFYAMSSVMGPSFYIRLTPQHTIGFVSRARFVASGRGIDNALSYYQYEPKPFFQDINVSPFRLASAAWTELGLNYAYTQPTSNGQFSIGVTVKALQAYEGGFFRNDDRFFLQKLPNDSLAASAVNFSYAYTDSNIESDDYAPEKNGNGFSVDLGVVYTIEGNSDAIYDWKFGASLTDIGVLNFKQNASFHEVTIDDLTAIGTQAYQDLQGIEEVDELIETFSSQVLNDPTASLQANDFRMALPAAFSLQASKSIGTLAYLDATLVQGFPMGDAALQRGSLLALVPRFEHRWFGAALPITISDWQATRVGASVRLAFLTIGTEHLGSFISNNDLYGTDLYVSLKINPFSIGSGNRDRSSGWEGRGNTKMRGKKGRVKCYEF
ncbi:MAG: DUF5723 family protein [Chitinophagales bacterium]|nr:DUF5723 family protein [Chitinophagales bacterium]